VRPTRSRAQVPSEPICKREEKRREIVDQRRRKKNLCQSGGNPVYISRKERKEADCLTHAMTGSMKLPTKKIARDGQPSISNQTSGKGNGGERNEQLFLKRKKHASRVGRVT
jgi:hypothetical protein